MSNDDDRATTDFFAGMCTAERSIETFFNRLFLALDDSLDLQLPADILEEVERMSERIDFSQSVSSSLLIALPFIE